MVRSIWRLACALLVLVLLAACGGADKEAMAPNDSYAGAAAPAPAPPPPPPGAPPADAPMAAPVRAEMAVSRASDGDAILSDKKDARRESSPGPAAPAQPALLAQTQSTPAAKPSPAKATSGSGATAGDIAAVRGPMLIYTANITMAVFEVARALADLEDLARDVGGFMARRDDRSITLRVPVARFDESLKRIAKLGDVLHRDVTAEDVTEEFHDLEVRLKNLHAIRDRLEQLLARAAKVEDSLLIERELDRVAAEIDRIEGRMKFLHDRASYSTITVAFQPRSSEAVSKTPFRLPVPWLNELGLGRLLSL